ncbi:DUF6705 family protein [Xanthomarina gelatinilytica]|uniref:DUF6705 family protein n=1 Tax=Xanthomarina gelatinilytica TaxID=1137281 RepID=UPI003AA8268B
MKKILLITLLILTALSCKAQIIPIEEDINYRINEIEIPDGAYIKDVNNLLDKFIGAWTGTFDNKSYEFIVEEILYQSDIRDLSRDELIIKYIITDNITNQVIADTTTLPNNDPLIITGDYLDANGKVYHSDYWGFNSECGQNGYITMGVINNGTQMNFGLSVKGEIFDMNNCPNGPAEQVIPETIILTKQ